MIRIGLLIAVLAISAGPASRAGHAEDLCAELTLPADSDLSCRMAADGQPSAIIEPADAVFASLSRLTVWRLDRTPDDANRWLQDQVSLDLSTLADAIDAVGRSKDSPFANETFGALTDRWAEAVRGWGRLPLEGCEEPRPMRRLPVWQLACLWQAAGFEQHMTVRLIETPYAGYGLSIRAMGGERLRELDRIADSFLPASAT
ncbi:hypothetical protein [Marinivivus vitaminiproducens]|uniref:hypothetical protein n=1 Tax=Marinivivus vitaminiproducens TaxID=3035935 RepID=UPI00279BF9CC|nr:hypothetical protein P4R82_08005 [Geminicoccaceae bacterium SCSIO 64248]